MNYFKPLAALAVAVIAVIRVLSMGPIERPPGEVAPKPPEQVLIERADQIRHGKFLLQPRASYDIEARVLSVERYRTDAGSDLAPIDFAVGWGPMSDTATLKHFKMSQGGRYFIIYPDEQAIDMPTALRVAANMHLIPADDNVRQLLFATRPGNIVILSGYLVNASRSDGFHWNTSLSREDNGSGACELMYVKSVRQR